MAADHLHELQYIPNAAPHEHRHQGRKRQFPHVAGNFATHVYIIGTLQHGQLPLMFHLESNFTSLSHKSVTSTSALQLTAPEMMQHS